MPQLPPLLFGLILSIYWGRVMRMVYKMRRRGAGNFRPPEKLGRILRLIWIPTVFVWIVHPYIVALADEAGLPRAMRPVYHSAAAGWAAAVVGVASLAATMACWNKMGKSWRMGINPDEKTQLIVSGPYAYVRHPIYALSSLLMIATIAAVPTPVMFLAGAIHLAFLQWESVREEKYLLAHHGQGYADYRRQVGRFLPWPGRHYRATQQRVA